MANITTYGVGSQFTKDALMGLGATETDRNGRFYLDGNMVNVELSRVIAETIYIYDIFRDGQSITGKYTATPERNGAVRVMLDTPLPFASRTVSYGGRPGTDGNAGTITAAARMVKIAPIGSTTPEPTPCKNARNLDAPPLRLGIEMMVPSGIF